MERSKFATDEKDHQRRCHVSVVTTYVHPRFLAMAVRRT